MHARLSWGKVERELGGWGMLLALVIGGFGLAWLARRKENA